MHCAAVQKRLVAWQDRELSPGEAVRVSEHLETCAACADAERRLASVEIDPPEIPPQIAARLHAATNIDAILAAAEDEGRRTPFPPEPWWRRTLLDAVEVPAWSVMVAAAAVMLLAGLAVQSQLELQSTQAELEQAARTIAQREMPEGPRMGIPEDQYKPASYQPGEEQGNQ